MDLAERHVGPHMFHPAVLFKLQADRNLLFLYLPDESLYLIPEPVHRLRLEAFRFHSFQFFPDKISGFKDQVKRLLLIAGKPGRLFPKHHK